MKFLLSAIAMLVLSACAGPGSWLRESPAGQTQPKDRQNAAACHEQRCIITVTVRNCVVTVDPYFIVMTHKDPVTMVWQIRGTGAFAPAPIRWKTREASRTFAASKGDEKTVVVINNRSVYGIFDYGVTVKEGEKTCPELDPTGINVMP
jgi:hypothetical protein